MDVGCTEAKAAAKNPRQDNAGQAHVPDDWVERSAVLSVPCKCHVADDRPGEDEERCAVKHGDKEGLHRITKDLVENAENDSDATDDDVRNAASVKPVPNRRRSTLSAPVKHVIREWRRQAIENDLQRCRVLLGNHQGCDPQCDPKS